MPATRTVTYLVAEHPGRVSAEGEVMNQPPLSPGQKPPTCAPTMFTSEPPGTGWTGSQAVGSAGEYGVVREARECIGGDPVCGLRSRWPMSVSKAEPCR